MEMDAISKEHLRLETKANLQKPIDDVQKIIDQLKSAKAQLESGGLNTATGALAKLHKPINQSFTKLNDDLKEIYLGLNKYSRAVEKKFKDRPITFAENDVLSSHSPLINRAIAMHLLREGQFDVAATFIAEVNANPPRLPDQAGPQDSTMSEQHEAGIEAWDADFSRSAYKSTTLQRQFSDMYHTLHELRSNQNLAPAIAWARAHSVSLEARGSNLEYDLCTLQYSILVTSKKPGEGPLAAVEYARSTFPRFLARYAEQTYALLGALAFTCNIDSSPYGPLLSTTSNPRIMTAAAAGAFTTEFCALLSLSSTSPLLTAVTAGCIALPTLLKLSHIQSLVRTSWTTVSELPVEVPLPALYHFHSIFVCPVSKEQGTDANPPMLMPCGHVLARESLEKISRNTRFKCPYCPQESHPRDAKQIYL